MGSEALRVLRTDKVVRMPKWVYHEIKDATPAVVSLTPILFKLCDSQGVIHNYSIPYLADQIKMHRTSVYNALSTLVELGVATWDPDEKEITLRHYTAMGKDFERPSFDERPSADSYLAYFVVPSFMFDAEYMQWSIAEKRLCLYLAFRQITDFTPNSKNKRLYLNHEHIGACVSRKNLRPSMVKRFINTISNKVHVWKQHRRLFRFAMPLEAMKEMRPQLAIIDMWLERDRLKTVFSEQDKLDFCKVMARTDCNLFKGAWLQFIHVIRQRRRKDCDLPAIDNPAGFLQYIAYQIKDKINEWKDPIQHLMTYAQQQA